MFSTSTLAWRGRKGQLHGPVSLGRLVTRGVTAWGSWLRVVCFALHLMFSSASGRASRRGNGCWNVRGELKHQGMSPTASGGSGDLSAGKQQGRAGNRMACKQQLNLKHNVQVSPAPGQGQLQGPQGAGGSAEADWGMPWAPGFKSQTGLS